MQDAVKHADGGWHYAVGRGADGGYVAWAKRTPILTDCPVCEPGEVWFACGQTEAEALGALKEETRILVL